MRYAGSVMGDAGCSNLVSRISYLVSRNSYRPVWENDPGSIPGGEKIVSDEMTLRHDVALANRIIERFGLSKAFGHVSARIPGTNRFLIPTRRSPGLADENQLLTLDTDGKILSGEWTPN